MLFAIITRHASMNTPLQMGMSLYVIYVQYNNGGPESYPIDFGTPRYINPHVVPTPSDPSPTAFIILRLVTIYFLMLLVLSFVKGQLPRSEKRASIQTFREEMFQFFKD